MAQGRIEIQFEPKGDQALIGAIKQLDIVTKRLQGTTSVYEKGAKKAANTQKKLLHTVKNASPAYQKLTSQLLAQDKTWKQLGVSQKLVTAAAKGNRVAIEKLRIAYKRTTAQTRILGGAFSVLRSKLLIYSFGVGLASKAILDQVKAFGVQQDSVERLSVAFGQDGARALDDYSSELQKVTTFGDEVTNVAMATIGMYGASAESTMKLTKGTMDLATALNMDLVGASQLVAKTIGSSTNALSRYGIEIDATASQEEKAAQATRELERVFGGLAEAMAKTTQGQITQAQNALGDLQETVGGLLAPAVVILAKALKFMAEALQNPVIIGAAVTFTAIATASAFAGAGVTGFTAATKLATIAQTAFNVVAKANPYVLLASALLGVATAIGVYKIGTRELTAEQKKQIEAAKAVKDAEEKAKEAAEKYADSVKRVEEELRKKLAILRATSDIEKHAIENGIELKDVNAELFYQVQQLNEERKAEENLLSSINSFYNKNLDVKLDNLQMLMTETELLILNGTNVEKNTIALAEMDKTYNDLTKNRNESNKSLFKTLNKVNQEHAKDVSIIKLSNAQSNTANTLKEKEELFLVKKLRLQELIDKGLIEGNALIAAQTNLKREELEIEQQVHQAKIDNAFELAEITSSLITQRAEQTREAANSEISIINEQKQKEMDILHSQRSFQKASAAAQDKMEQDIIKKHEKREKEARDKANKRLLTAFRADQALSIAKTIMHTSEAAMRAMGQTGIFGFPMASIIKAMGAMEVAMIASQTPPKMAQGGLVGGRRHAQGGTMIEAERGEFVVSRRGVDAMGIEALNRINAGQGGGTTNISFSGNVLSKDFLEDEAIPQIKEALRRGGDIGVG